MSSTLHKIVDKLSGKESHADNPQSDNYGPHSTATANKLDPRIDSDADGRANPASNVGGYGHTQQTTHHISSPIGGATHTGGATTVGDNYQSTNAGPHSSNLANKLDPRVDSDRDGRSNLTSSSAGYGTTASTTTGQHGSGTSSGLSSGPGATNVDNPRSTNYGPHDSNLLNTLDPRVDSDASNVHQHTTPHHGHGQTTTGGLGSSGYTGTQGAFDQSQSTNAGPHSSNLLNKLDPRVDSDQDGRGTGATQTDGYGHTQTGAGTGGVFGSTTHQHTGTGHSPTGAQGYTGTNNSYDNPRSTNTGPHSSNLLNKLDPRVDSDRDGRDDPSSRVGGYGETQSSGTGGVGRY